MVEAFERARDILEERLREVEAEAQELRKALGSLPPVHSQRSQASERQRASGKRVESAGQRQVGKKRTKRAARGEREAQLLESISGHPNHRVSEHAQAIGISAQQAYPLLKRLTAAGKIERTESGYRVKK